MRTNEQDSWAVGTLMFLVAVVIFGLCSCGPFISVKDGYVSTGFLSSTQAFSGALKNKDGSVTWSVVGSDGTSVANTGIMAWGAAKAVQGTTNVVRSNNNAATLQGAQKPTILTNKAADGSVTETAVFPPTPVKIK